MASATSFSSDPKFKNFNSGVDIKVRLWEKIKIKRAGMTVESKETVESID